MILTIYLSGILLSILIDLVCYSAVKRGLKIESFPPQYLRYSTKQLLTTWFGWSLLWPIILGMTVFTNVWGLIKK